MLLWQEYKEGEPSGYQYSQFCELYRQWRKKLDRSMRQEHRAGEKFFVDYSGQTVPVVDATTGEVRDARMFVGVMGGSNQTYAEEDILKYFGSDFNGFNTVSTNYIPTSSLKWVALTWGINSRALFFTSSTIP
jgi:hypothetical protein